MHLQLSTRTRGAALLVACAALTLTVGPSAQSPAPLTISAPADPVVTVLGTGAEPRRALRYTVAPGASERIDLTMRMSMAMAMGEQSMPPMDIPPIRMGINVDVKSVAPSGDIAFTFGFADMAMEGGAMPPGAGDAIKSVTGTVTMNDRGIVKAMNFNTAAIADPSLKQLMSSAGIEKLASPLPAEPMGVGGRWEVRQAIEINGMRTDQKMVFEVTALDASSATLKVTTEQSAPAQKLSPPGMPAGAEVSLVSMTGGGGGTLTLRPGTTLLLGDMDVTSKVVMDISAEGQQQRMGTDTRMRMTIAQSKR